MTTPIRFDAAKFKEAIVHISKRSESDNAFGSVKLNKVLFYADFRAYTQIGSPITGATYRHLSEGPAPREMLRSRDDLVHDGAIIIETRQYFNRQQKRPVAQRPADLSVFSGQEVAILDAAIELLWGKDAQEASDLSHREWGWKLTSDDEDIPYALAWLSPDPLTEDQIAAGEALASEISAG